MFSTNISIFENFKLFDLMNYTFLNQKLLLPKQILFSNLTSIYKGLQSADVLNILTCHHRHLTFKIII